MAQTKEEIERELARRMVGLGEEFEAARRARGWTRKQLAERSSPDEDAAACRRDTRRAMAQLGRQFTDLRSARGWSATELAEAAGVPVEIVEEIEAGHDADITYHHRLAMALGVRLSLVPKSAHNSVTPWPKGWPVPYTRRGTHTDYH